jgi:hypothetical protein
MSEPDDYWIRLNLTRKRYDALRMALRFHQVMGTATIALSATRDLLEYVESKAIRDRRYRDAKDKTGEMAGS